MKEFEATEICLKGRENWYAYYSPALYLYPPSLLPSLPFLPSLPQDLAIRLLPFRVDGGAQAFNLVKEGEEIDWVALAKGRHNYKERLERGEVTALSPSLESSVPASAAA